MGNISLYSPTISAEFIDISRDVLTFFRQRDRVIRLPLKNEEGVIISYNAVVGEHPQKVPREILDKAAFYDLEEFYFDNDSPESTKDADQSIIKALRFIFGPGHYSDIKKYYMVNTGTTPIKIKFSNHGKGSRDSMYVKRPDTNRIVGRFFYDIISGLGGTDWGFNRLVFIEEGIPGSIASKINEKTFIGDPLYDEGLIRAAVHSDFLGLYLDVKNPRNRIIDSGLRTILFDFNLMFEPRLDNTHNFLLEYFNKLGGHFNKRLREIYSAERYAVAMRIESHDKAIYKLARAAGKLTDHSTKTIDERIRTYYSAKSLEDYIQKKAFDYRTSSDL